MKALFRRFIGFFAAIIGRFKCQTQTGIVLLGLACLLHMGQAANGQTIRYVDGQNGLTLAQGANGQGWSTAYKYLTDALAAVPVTLTTDWELRVLGAATQDGLIYRPDESSAILNGSGNRAATFTLRNRVAIRGSYSGTQNAQGQDIRDHLKYKSVLDGDLSGLQGTLGNDADVTVDVNGNLVFTNYGENSQHIVTASGTDDTAVLDGFEVRGGNSVGAANPSGAGLIVSNAGPVVIRCQFKENTATDGVGGAVNVENNTQIVSFVDCSFGMNRAYYGGALYFFTEGEIKIVNASIRDNQAVDVVSPASTIGGGIYASGGMLRLTNTLLANNRATVEGGGIWMRAQLIMTNCTIAANQLVPPSSSATTRGGGIFHYSMTTTPGLIQSTIFWGNSAQSGSEIYSDAPLNIRYSDVRDRLNTGAVGTLTWGPGNIGENLIAHDPKFYSASELRLRCFSPCVDSADPSVGVIPIDEFNVDSDLSFGEPTPDLDRRSRAYPSTPDVDMGSYERHGCSGDVDDNGVVNIDDLLMVIGTWGNPCTGSCLGDIFPSACGGDGNVDMDDLLLVIGKYDLLYTEDCEGHYPPEPSSLESVLDCMDAATEKGMTAFSPEWVDAVNGCADALCVAQIIECD